MINGQKVWQRLCERINRDADEKSAKCSEKAISELADQISEGLDAVIARESRESRAFERATGARLTIAALLHVGAIKTGPEGYDDQLRAWMHEGGNSTLRIDDVSIVPPETV